MLLIIHFLKSNYVRTFSSLVKCSILIKYILKISFLATQNCCDHLVRIIKQKAELLSKNSALRRIPKDFPASSRGTLADLITWLIPWTAKTEKATRHKAMEYLSHITLKSDIRLAIERSGFTTDRLVSVANDGPHEDMEQDLASIELATWLVERGIVKIDRIKVCTLIMPLSKKNFLALKKISSNCNFLFMVEQPLVC